MPRMFKSGVLKGIIILVGFALMMNTFVIMAQDEPPQPPPTDIPTDVPTDIPPIVPTDVPTEVPTDVPTEVPTEVPTDVPTEVPTEIPTEVPTEVVTEVPPVEPTEPAVVPVLAPEPELTLLVRELFDNGDLSPWSLVPGWSLISSENGLALQVVNTNEALHSLKGTFYNVAVQARFLLSSGSAQVNVRQSQVGAYTASLDATGVVTLTRGTDILGSAVVPALDATLWHSVRVSAFNDVVRVSIDNAEVIAVSDSAPLPPGDVSLSAAFLPPADGAAVPSLVADDFFLWVPTTEITNYPQPTVIAPPVVVVPTEEIPTAEPPTAVPPTEVPPVVELPPGKATSLVPPPTADQLMHALASNNNTLATAATISSIYALPPSLSNSDNGDTTGSPTANEAGETGPAGCGVNVAQTVWFKFTPVQQATAATYTISLAGSNFDTVLGVYTSTPSPAFPLTQVACNDDFSAGVETSQLNLVVAANTAPTYYIQIGGYQQDFGLYNIKITKVGAPVAGVPVATTPLAAAVSANPQPAFNWNASANSTAYEFQLSTVSTFTSIFATSGPIAATTFTPAAPLAPGVYYWRVHGINSAGIAGGNSAARMITIKTAYTALTALADNAVVTSTRPTFSWGTFGPGAKYTLQLSDTNDFTVPGVDFEYLDLTTLSKAITNSLHQGVWYWRVVVQDATAFPASPSPVRSFTVNLLKTPLANANTITATASANVVFTWFTSPLTPTTGYKVEIVAANPPTLPDFTTPFNSCLGALPTTATCTISAVPTGTYYWRVVVNGLDGAGTVAGNPYRQFTVTPAVPVAPVLYAPATASFTALDAPQLSWKPSTSVSATQYELQVGNAAFTSIAFTHIYDAANDCAPTVVPPIITLCSGNTSVLSDGLYSWRVRSINSVGGAGAYSAARTFTVKTVAPNLSLPAANGVAITVRPTFSWVTYGGTGAKYTLQLSDTNVFSGGTPDIDFEYPDLTTLSKAITNSLHQGDWFWRIIAKDSAGVATAPGASRKFTVNLLKTPLDNANIISATTANVVFSWYTAPLAPTTGYKVEIVAANPPTPPNFASPLTFCNGALPTTATCTISNVAAGIYYWRVVVNGLEVAPVASHPYRIFTVTPAVPAAPVLLGPATAVTIWTHTPTLTFKPSISTLGKPYKYEVQVGNAGFTVINFSLTTSNLETTLCTGVAPNAVCSVPVTTLPNGLYSWRVRTVNTVGGAGAYSAPRTFTIANPTVPTLSLPADNSNTTVVQPTFTWTKPVGAVKFNVYMDTNPNPTVLRLDGTNLLVTTFKPAGSLLPGSTYYWKVQAYDVLGTPSGFSLIRSVKIVTATTAAPMPNRFAPENPAGYQVPKLSWGPISWALWYVVEIDDATNFTTPLLRTPNDATVLGVGIQSIQEGVGGFPVLPNGIYYWRVKACDTISHCGAWSTVGSFAVDR